MITVSAGQTEGAKANGDTRTIYLHHAHTHESIEATYMVDGRYDSGVLEKLNWFLRDWRRDESIHMDPRLFDTIWEVYREAGSRLPIEVMSAYRSPETNAMLRRRSRAVAEHSQHILGKAMDQHYVDVPMSRIREIAMKLQRGGVGFYPTAGTPFVHMDVGGVRHWPRMSYDQLARLFPDGKTVHIPSNGQPLPGYELARAELEARGDSFSYPTATEVKSKGFFAWLFGGSDEDEDNSSESRTASKRGGQTRVASLDRGSTGSVPPSSSEVFSMSGRDDGAHSFTLAESASRTGSAAPPLRRGPVDQPAPVRVASRPAEPSSDEQAKAQQALAQAMVEQDRTKQAADAATAAAASAKLAEPPEAPPAALDQALASPVPTTFAPMPPRRPIELASDGPAAPLPPGRPTEFAGLAGLNSDRAPGVTTPARRDSIGALIADAPPSRVAGLPAAITAGARPEALPQVLAYAAPIQSAAAVPPLRPLVPIPVARPSFVAARLDRSNFRTLTGSSAAMRAQGRSGLGSAVAALRPAAQSSLGVMTASVLAGAGQGFKIRATDLPSDHFAGQAVKPREHVVTAAGAVKASAD